MKQRVVVLGCGDTGLLTAVRLPRRAEVTVVAPKGGMVSGQELGLRLARPATWLSTSVFAADRYRGLRGSTVLHGRAHRVDPDARTVTVDLAAGGHCAVVYDVLVIATGATNGFWRTDALESITAVKRRVAEQASTSPRPRPWRWSRPSASALPTTSSEPPRDNRPPRSPRPGPAASSPGSTRGASPGARGRAFGCSIRGRRPQPARWTGLGPLGWRKEGRRCCRRRGWTLGRPRPGTLSSTLAR